MKEEKKLVINADDYGMDDQISSGIREAHLNGVVTTTTAIMNTPVILQELEIAKEKCPNLEIGVHLLLTIGKPIRPANRVHSLVDHHDKFYHFKSFPVETFNLVHVYDEWQAQIEKFLSAGMKLSHLDSHHHISYINEDMFTTMLQLAKEYDVPVRFPPQTEYNNKYHPVDLFSSHDIAHPDRLITSFHLSDATNNEMIRILQNLEPGTSELMCHPGYLSPASNDTYNGYKFCEQELAVLTNQEISKEIDRNNIILSTYSSLTGFGN